jgi:CheY-like chemotaxis protein
VYEAARELRRPFDAVLLDNQMPVMDGPTCVKTLRAIGMHIKNPLPLCD